MPKKSLYRLSIALLIITLGIALIYERSKLPMDLITLPNQSFKESSSSCINCHGKLEGMSAYHSEIGCVSCHFGNNTSSDKDSAHIDLISIPGNFSNADQACGMCHPQALSDIKNSLMTSNSGIISIDRFIFGSGASPDKITHVDSLGFDAADSHIRNLCSHCHLGNEKTEFGAIGQLSRGGGCNACHLNYSEKAAFELSFELNDSTPRKYHPSLDLNISNDHCFGCHSRSGRISTNYEGWHETLLSKDSIIEGRNFRILEDDRVFRFIQEDVHHSRGMECIDCHPYKDVMGDGKSYAHQEQAVKINCSDCHFTGDPSWIDRADLSFTEWRILSIRKNENQRFLKTANDSSAILNSSIDKNNKAYLTRKSDGVKLALRVPAESCNRDAAHQDISCSACHSSWEPQCIGCHTDFDPNAKGYDLSTGKDMHGSWIEYAGEFLADPPVLGVRKNNNERTIQAAMPGMIMTLDPSSFKGSEKEKTAFHRLFAPSTPHTTAAKGRSCTSCHSNPLALGYGRGKLVFEYKVYPPIWKFEADYEDLRDQLPADAWIGFLEEHSTKQYSSRLDFMPFSLEEQKRILTVGACFSCHKQDSKTMMESLKINFEDYKKKMSVKCILPVFE